MVEKVNFSSVNFRANTPDIKEVKVASTYKNNDVDTTQKEGFYVDKKTAEAIKNYMTNPVNMNEPVSLEDYKTMLTKSGLVEGKDFEVINFPSRKADKTSYVIRIVNKDNPEQVRKVVCWKNGNGIENYDGCTDTYYLSNGGDRESFSISRDPKGRITEQTTVYSNPDNHKNLFPEGIDLDTKPEDYKKMLEEKNVKYSVKSYGEKENVVQFVEYADDGKTKVKMTVFENLPDGKAVDQVVYDENGKFMHATNLVNSPSIEGGYKLYVTQSIDEILKVTKNMIL